MPAPHQIEEALDEHLAHAMEPDLERRALAQCRRRRVRRIEPREDVAKRGIVAMPQDQRLRDRIAERSDAELQRAAVGHDARDMQAGGIFGEIDRLARRREQRKVASAGRPA